MKISIIQTDIKWENKSQNFHKYEKLIRGADHCDIIVLPEMFSTGFTANSESLSERPHGETYDWMVSIAERSNSGICGSYLVRIGKKHFNRWVFVAPDKKSWFYDKRHLFKMDNVENRLTPGTKRLIFKFRGFRICPIICYDLRFPVWCRNRNDYDLLINSADWPMARRDVWITLLKARAIENQAFVAAANRIGTDGTNTSYCGDSMILSPKGAVMASAGRNKECTISAELSISELKAFLKKFPASLDADDFVIKV